jgi:hypothetical protein
MQRPAGRAPGLHPAMASSIRSAAVCATRCPEPPPRQYGRRAPAVDANASNSIQARFCEPRRE